MRGCKERSAMNEFIETFLTVAGLILMVGLFVVALNITFYAVCLLTVAVCEILGIDTIYSFSDILLPIFK